MDLAKIRGAIGRCQNPEDLLAIAKAASERASALRHRAAADAAMAEERAWERTRAGRRGEALLATKSIEGALLWVSPDGRRKAAQVASSIPAGTALEIIAVQPRAKRIWARGAAGEAYCLAPRDLERIGARAYPDEFRAMVAWSAGRAG